MYMLVHYYFWCIPKLQHICNVEVWNFEFLSFLLNLYSKAKVINGKSTKSGVWRGHNLPSLLIAFRWIREETKISRFLLSYYLSIMSGGKLIFVISSNCTLQYFLNVICSQTISRAGILKRITCPICRCPTDCSSGVDSLPTNSDKLYLLKLEKPLNKSDDEA